MMYGSASSTRARSRGRQQEEEGVSRHAAPVRVTIFSAPRPPPEGSPARQELAVRSWLALPGNVSVVLLGASHAAAALAERLGSRVTVDAAIDSAFTGTPFFHSMVARAQAASDSDICVLTDAEIVLLPDFVNVITRLSKVDRDWFLVSMSRNTTKFQYQPIDSGSDWVHKHGKKELQEIPADKWVADSSDRGIIMAWNNPSNPLQAGVLPPFLYGRDVHNSWFMHEVVSSEMRLIFDASSLVLGLHPPEGFILMHTMSLSKNGRLPIGSSWDYSVNQYLAAVYGSYCYQLPRRHSTMLYKVVKHSEDYKLSKGDVLTLSNFVTGKEDKVYTHGSNPWRKEDICFSWHDHSNSFMTSAPVDLPYSLSILLELVADKNRSVVLGVAGENYRDMLMSWVCRLRYLGITNFIVCALDHEIYEFSVLQFSDISYH